MWSRAPCITDFVKHASLPPHPNPPTEPANTAAAAAAASALPGFLQRGQLRLQLRQLPLLLGQRLLQPVRL